MAANGFLNPVSASIASNTTTTLVAAPGATQRIWVYYVGVDTSAAGTTSTASFQGSTGAGAQFALFATTAVGHVSDYYATNRDPHPGWALPLGDALQVVTAGAAAATSRFTVIYEIKGF